MESNYRRITWFTNTYLHELFTRCRLHMGVNYDAQDGRGLMMDKKNDNDNVFFQGHSRI